MKIPPMTIEIYDGDDTATQIFSQYDASMKVPPMPIKTHGGDDTQTQKECRQMNFELDNIIIRDRIERGHLVLCHLRIVIFEKCVTLQIFQIAYIRGFSTFFVILCIYMYFHAIKSSTFTKMGEFLLYNLNLQKFCCMWRQNVARQSFFQFFCSDNA